jgi:RNA polymerase sigma-70 factor, ECF subfamily
MSAWPTAGLPDHPRAWLIGTARHKALDALRRESLRNAKEAAAVRNLDVPSDASAQPVESPPEERLALIFLCCHPALDPEVRVALTLRAVSGLSPAQIAAVFLVSEQAMAKRLVLARRKIRDIGLRLAVPTPDALAERLPDVLRVAYLVFTEGHHASSGPTLVRDSLCDTAIALTDGPNAGLAILDGLAEHPQLAGWPALQWAAPTCSAGSAAPPTRLPPTDRPSRSTRRRPSARSSSGRSSSSP